MYIYEGISFHVLALMYENFYDGYLGKTICHYKQVLYFDYGYYNYIQTDFGVLRDLDLRDNCLLVQVDDTLFYQRLTSIQVPQTNRD